MAIDYYKNKNAAIINLNRPQYLNTLNFEMIKEIDAILKDVETNNSIKMIIFKGEGDKAFCAGGDVKSFYEEKFTDSNTLRKNFFYEEYKLNYKIRTFEKPIISLVHGICMGGGVGLAMHGDLVIASENVTFAMPETAIGLFPDVGAGKILSNLEGDLGLYLALTGKRVKTADLIFLGLANQCVKRSDFEKIEQELSLLENEEDMFSIAKDLSVKTEPVYLPKYVNDINNCFKFNSIEEIIEALRGKNNEWSKETIDLINKMSPTSLKITLKQIRLAKNMTLSEDLTMEYRMSQGCMNGHDFYEGVRSVLVDKDYRPKWNPSSLKNISDDIIDEHFKSLGSNDLIL